MSKETGSFESIIRGVSEQVPHDRYVGQHWMQDNFVSDPVRGLGRRHGSVMRTEKLMPGVLYDTPTREDAARYKEYTFFINSVEYSLLYRPDTKVVGSTMPGVVCINKDTYQILDVAVNPSDLTAVQAALDGGISAVGNIAKYLLLAPRNRVPTLTQTDNVAASAALATAWVKQGTYSRTYTIEVTDGAGVKIGGGYTTPSSYYPGTLNTSDIPATATDYQKQVNDRVYAYQTAVNQWIGTSAAAIQPENIALQLATSLVANGMSPTVVGAVGSHVVLAAGYYVEVDDGGDGSAMKGVAQEVQSINDLSPIHRPGKYVRIRPKGQVEGDSSGVFYVKASPKDNSGIVDWKEVIWTEAPGIEQAPTFLTLLGQIIGNTLYLATSQANLQAVSGDTNQTEYSHSRAGDLDSQPIPGFFGKRVDYIGNFQDRLMLVAGSTVVMSKSGDYFNFYRTSSLTIADDDPIEVFALGSEGDVITDGVMMDRSLLLFGKQKQYALDGRQAMTPKTQYIAVQSAYEDTTTCPPIDSGNYVFFSQLRDNRLTLQQMQTGDYADSFRAYEITSQLDGYLAGTPCQILALTSPAVLVVRTKEFANGFWTFSYLDSADQTQRLYDAWSRWVWSEQLGQLFGVTGRNGNILSMTLRSGAAGVAFVLDEFSRSANLDTSGYIDSRRPWSNTTGSISLTWTPAGIAASAVVMNKAAGQYFLLGQPLADYQKLVDTGVSMTNAEMGTMFDSAVEPTAPYMRDAKEKAILDSTLILGSYSITLSKSSAMRGYLRGMTQDVSEQYEILDWIYRPAGSWVLNTQQIAETISIPVDIMQEVRDFRLRLTSRNWLPLTLSSIEWAGQFYTQRNA